TNSDIRNLEIKNTDVGIQIACSSNIVLTGNNVLNNGDGLALTLSSNTTVSNNTISNNNYYGIYLLWSSNNTVKDNDGSNNQDGMTLSYSSKNNITGNNFSNNRYGLHFVESSNNTISGNNITNSDSGIVLSQSLNNTIIDNNVLFSLNKYGLELFFASENYIIGNNVSYNMYAFALSYSLNNTITGNYVSNNDVGVFIEDSSHNNTITGNDVLLQQDYGFFLWSSYNNSIYHNNIIDNSYQAFDNTNNGNQWDNGYPMGGNYWSNYPGVDNLKGPNQDIPGRDGIGDTYYPIDSNSQDNYPLIGPFPYFPTENYTILKQGWNLISIPLIQEEQDLTRVLGSIDGLYDAVHWYDIIDANDPWKHCNVGKPFGNDLNNINATMGFWIYITQPGDTIFPYNGTQPTSNQTVTLHPGWNMIGYPTLANYNRTEGLNNLTFGQEVDLIQWYDAGTKTWHDMAENDYFELCRGYWIHANVECVWEVPL
ncbi:MAG: right-handed parallel beta-helix repeat-containing protein, partial [Methanomassiliicoccales archaeon]